MDRDRGTYQGVGGSSSGDDVHETSFMTASDGDENHAAENSVSNESIKSSRSMPVPDYMMRKSQEHLHVEENQQLQAGVGNDNEPPPPSYNEVVSGQLTHEGTEQRDNEDELTPEEIAIIMSSQENLARAEAEDNEDELTPEEIAIIMSSQENLARAKAEDQAGGNDNELTHKQAAVLEHNRKDRSKYLERKHSFEEAIEMQYRKNQQLPKDDIDAANADTLQIPPPRQIEQMQMHDVEGAQERKEFTCSGWGPLDEPMTSFCRFLRRQSRNRLILFSLLIIGILGILLFVSLFPASFVYIDYHEIALKQSKMTNVVDRDTVYYHGCYVLGPDTQLIKFDASVQNVIEEMNVFTLDTIAIGIRYSVHYFLRAPEIGKLFTLFMKDYDDVFRLIIRSSLRNFAGSQLTVDNFRFNRTYVETQIHANLRRRLGGDCCPACCYGKVATCQSNAYCNQCQRKNCNQGYYVDVRFFNLLSVSIPNEVFEKLLLRTIMEVNKEKEFFLQDHSITEKKTDFLVKNITNDARQLIENGKSEAAKIMMIAEAEQDQIVQAAHIKGLKGLFSRLNVTNEDDQLSVMMIQAFEQNKDNLYATYGFDEHTIYTP